MGKQILLCAAACSLLSVLLLGCQTERKTNYNRTSSSGLSGKQGSNSHNTTSRHTNTAPKNYYITNKNITKIAPKPDVKPAAVLPPIATAQPVPVSIQQEQSIGSRDNNVTIIIKDSVLPKDTRLIAVTNPDTILFKETNKEEINEAEPGVAEEVAPLSVEEMDTVISKYAEMISVDRSEISNFNLYLFIDGWYGTRYKWGGTDSTGIDCSAFSQKLYGKVYGVEILRTARQQHRHCERIKYPDDASEGDLLFFRIHRLRVSHVGVYLANGYFVHSSSSKGVVISNLNNKYWRRRFAGCGRIPHEEKSITESDYIQ